MQLELLRTITTLLHEITEQCVERDVGTNKPETSNSVLQNYKENALRLVVGGYHTAFQKI
jgi:hypothetical protein